MRQVERQGWRHGVRAMLAAVLVLAALGLVGPAAGAQTGDSCAVDITDYEGTATVTVDNLNPQAGDTVTFVGSGFPPNSTVPLALNDEIIGSPTTDDAGAFSFAYTIPADLPVGSTLTFSATCGAFVLTQTLTITAAGTPVQPGTPSGPLPVTGSDNGWMVRTGLALVAAGGLVLLVVRRRQQATVPVA